MGLLIIYGPAGTDEERLEVADFYVLHWCGSWLTLVRTAGSGYRLRIRVYPASWDTADVYWDNEDLIAKRYAYIRHEHSPV